jgi:hypothetical protein
MKTIKSYALNEIDRLIVESFWDAEIIAREQDCPIYYFSPSGPQDDLIATRIGVTVAIVLKSPVIIWKNNGEET